MEPHGPGRLDASLSTVNASTITLADEPTAALDSSRAQLVMDLLRKLAAEQEASIVTVTPTRRSSIASIGWCSCGTASW